VDLAVAEGAVDLEVGVEEDSVEAEVVTAVVVVDSEAAVVEVAVASVVVIVIVVGEVVAIKPISLPDQVTGHVQSSSVETQTSRGGIHATSAHNPNLQTPEVMIAAVAAVDLEVAVVAADSVVAEVEEIVEAVVVASVAVIAIVVAAAEDLVVAEVVVEDLAVAAAVEDLCVVAVVVDIEIVHTRRKKNSNQIPSSQARFSMYSRTIAKNKSRRKKMLESCRYYYYPHSPEFFCRQL